MTLLSMSCYSSVDRALAWCTGGHGFDSFQGLIIVSLSYTCVMLISSIFIHLQYTCCLGRADWIKIVFLFND